MKITNMVLIEDQFDDDNDDDDHDGHTFPYSVSHQHLSSRFLPPLVLSSSAHRGCCIDVHP